MYVLDCQEQTSVWIKWENGLIQAGVGVVPGFMKVVEWKDSSPYTIKAVTATTAGNNPGEWTFDQRIGEKMGMEITKMPIR